MAINKLNSTDTIAIGDQIPIGSLTNGDDRRISLSVLQAFLQANLTFSDESFTTQYSSPGATDFSIAITDGDDNIHLILTPLAGYAAGTIVLPSVANAKDKQEVLVNCTQAVTTLTINGNGANDVIGEPTTLAANDFFKLKYDSVTSNWYRIG